jgi:hypothetical protein
MNIENLLKSIPNDKWDEMTKYRIERTKQIIKYTKHSKKKEKHQKDLKMLEKLL